MSLWITILKLGTQDTLINTLDSQVGPIVNSQIHVIKAMVVMILDSQVSPNINIDIGEPQTNHQNIFNLEVAT
jgi:hypothetical protein